MAPFSVVVCDRETKFQSGLKSQKVENPLHYITCQQIT